MKLFELRKSLWVWITVLVAILFGLLTIISGGSVLFNQAAREAAGDYVGFVVWFNFLAGFAYVVAGVSLWLLRRWSIWVSLLITAATLIVFATFGAYILSGGAYEVRTVAALGLRSAVWLTISAIAYQNLNLKAKIVNRQS